MREGVPSIEELRSSPGYPSEGELERKALAVIECVEEIPCDPCVSSCPYGAIEIAGGLHGLPRLLTDACRGCGLCVAGCPGQAIFLVEYHFGPTEASVSFVYEFLPVPAPGGEVVAVDREGRSVCRARVIRVDNPGRNDRSPVVTLAVPRDMAGTVRGMEHLA
jgi:ferredoxin